MLCDFGKSFREQYSVLLDTRPIEAILIPDHPEHKLYRSIVDVLIEGRDWPLRTTWPVVTEVMHFISKNYRHQGRRRLIEFLNSETVEIVELGSSGFNRCCALIEQYGDKLVDIADISLLVIGEASADKRILTSDHADFSYLQGVDGYLKIIREPDDVEN